MRNASVILIAIFSIVACSKPTEKLDSNQVALPAYDAANKKVMVYTTAKDSLSRITQTGVAEFVPAVQALETEISIFVNPAKTFQTFIGVGGAITDASAEVFAKLSTEKQSEFLDAYYGDKGNNYKIVRTNIHSCDFSSASYTYVEEGDAALKTFSIEHDKQFRIPLIKKAFERAENNLILFASPWSPPAFMKDSKNMLRGGKLLPEYFQPWANYFVEFIKAYQAEGLPIWGLTIQNEPMATQTWESCIYTAEEERDFLKNYFGPTLEKAGFGDKKIIVWDHNRDLITQRANTILGDPEAAKYVWGVGFHWYEDWSGGEQKFDNLSEVKNAYPEKELFFTEGCNGPFNTAKYQDWKNAERYGNSMINDFNRGTVGWTDWNILLDETGGPNHVGNFCFAPIHADTKTGELIYTPAYYYIGHFSRFIMPGAKRVGSATSRSNLTCTTFLNTDGSLATVLLNQTDKPIKYKLYIGEVMASAEIPARAIQTIVY